MSQCSDALPNLTTYGLRLRFMYNCSYEPADLPHLGFFHSSGGHSRCANAQTRGNEWLILIEWDGVFVDSDQRRFQCLFSIFAGNSLPLHPDINKHQVVVSTT